MTGGRTRPDSRLNLRDGGRRDRPQPSPFYGSGCQTISRTACAIDQGRGLFAWQSALTPPQGGQRQRICDVQLPLRGCIVQLWLLQHQVHHGVKDGFARGLQSKGSEAMHLVFSCIDAGSGNRRGSGDRPNGPCKAMCFLVVQHHPRWASACDGSVSTCLPVIPGRLRMPRDPKRRTRCEY